jgi:hypothetical protein
MNAYRAVVVSPSVPFRKPLSRSPGPFAYTLKRFRSRQTDSHAGTQDSRIAELQTRQSTESPRCLRG